MGTVIALSIQEWLRRDDEAVAAIYRNLGAAAAERVVAHAFGELVAAMAQVGRCVHDRDLGDVPRQLRRVRVMAEGLGLLSLAGVAGDAGRCLERGDDTAFAAVWLRLARVAECSLAADRGTPGLSL